jgi:Tfp pilus assembly protein PilF
MLTRHEGFRQNRKAYAAIAAQIAFGRATSGSRKVARQWVRESLRRDPAQIKAWLALAISLRVLPASWLLAVLQRLGKGI